jgi:hypothetical protein
VRPSAEAPLAVPTRGRAGFARTSACSTGRHVDGELEAAM